jgi:hypothetical protein
MKLCRLWCRDVGWASAGGVEDAARPGVGENDGEARGAGGHGEGIRRSSGIVPRRRPQPGSSDPLLRNLD